MCKIVKGRKARPEREVTRSEFLLWSRGRVLILSRAQLIPRT